jgi:hypothetical protein
MDRRKAFLIAAGLTAALSLPAIVTAGDAASKSLEAMAAEAAKTPEQHQALAAYYREKAESARKEANLHEGMALSYGKTAAGGGAMAQHCNNIMKAAKEQATEYEALAEVHEAEAKKAGK